MADRVSVRLVLETSEAQKSLLLLQQAVGLSDKQLGRLIKQLEIVSTTGRGVAGANERSTKTFSDMTAKIGLLVAAGYALTRTFGSLLRESNAAEDANQRLAASLRVVGENSTATRDRMIQFGADMQKTTRYADDQIVTLQALLVSYTGLTGEGVQPLTRATIDLAAALNMDLDSAAQLVGKSIGSSTNALTRYGISITDGASRTERTADVINGINAKFGGLAEELASTESGAMARFNNRVSDMEERLGDALKKVIIPFLTPLGVLVDMIADAPVAFQAAGLAATAFVVILKALSIELTVATGGWTALLAAAVAFVAWAGSAGDKTKELRAQILATGNAVDAFKESLKSMTSEERIAEIKRLDKAFAEQLELVGYLRKAVADGLYKREFLVAAEAGLAAITQQLKLAFEAEGKSTGQLKLTNEEIDAQVSKMESRVALGERESSVLVALIDKLIVQSDNETKILELRLKRKEIVEGELDRENAISKLQYEQNIITRTAYKERLISSMMQTTDDLKRLQIQKELNEMTKDELDAVRGVEELRRSLVLEELKGKGIRREETNALTEYQDKLRAVRTDAAVAQQEEDFAHVDRMMAIADEGKKLIDAGANEKDVRSAQIAAIDAEYIRHERTKTEIANTESAARKEIQASETAATLSALDGIFGALQSITSENFELQKAFAIARAIMNTYEAATKALASAPPPLNYVLAAAVTAAGFANIAKITSSKPQGFGGGGYTGDGSASEIAGPAHRGEVVFEKPIVDRHRDQLLSLRKSLQGGGMRGYRDGGFVGDLPGIRSGLSISRSDLAGGMSTDAVRAIVDAIRNVKIVNQQTFENLLDGQRFIEKEFPRYQAVQELRNLD